MSQFWFWLLAPEAILVVRVVRHPGFIISVALLLLVGGCFVFTQPDKSGKAVHDLFSDSGSAPTTSDTTTSATTTARDPATGQSLPAWECPSGWACFWDGSDGTGNRCKWNDDDPDWSFGNVRCSWSKNAEVRSVFDNSRHASPTLSYFADANFRDHVGCTEPGQKANLPTPATVHSHKWINGNCPEHS